MGTDVRLGTACCLSVMPCGVLLFRLRLDFSKIGLHTLLLHVSLESQILLSCRKPLSFGVNFSKKATSLRKDCLACSPPPKLSAHSPKLYFKGLC